MDRRSVGRLSLRASRTDDVPVAVRTIQEALRLATMPGDGRPGRLFVRRIDVGDIDLRRGVQSVAHLLSERMRGLRSAAVSIAAADASRADVVLARDPVEPVALAIHRAATDRPLDAWFWARVEPAWFGRGRHEIVVRAWEVLIERADAPVAMAGVVGALLDAGCIEEACRPIPSECGRRLWTASAARSEGPSMQGGAAALVDDPIPSQWRAPLRRLVRQWGHADPRSWWVILAAMRASYPGATLGRVDLVRTLVEHYHAEPSTHLVVAPLRDECVVTSVDVREGSPEGAHPGEPWPPIPRRQAREAEASLVRAEDSDRPERTTVGDHRVRGDLVLGTEADPPSASRPRDEAEEMSSSRSSAAELRGGASLFEAHRSDGDLDWGAVLRPVPTSCGGLWFVLAILERLGIGPFLEQHPHLDGVALAARVLLRLADGLEVPPDEPARIPLQVPPPPSGIPAFVVPPAWIAGDEPVRARWLARVGRVVLVDARGHGLALLAAPSEALRSELAWLPEHDEVTPMEVLVDAWCAAVRRWLSQHTELSLPELVMRDGAIRWTRTHIDLVFDLQHADIRVRRAMLDLDPGWAPWLGRVVGYHYVHRGILGDD